MDELRPCPFCGKEVRIIHDIMGVPEGVHCRCGAFVRFMFMPKRVNETFGETQKRIAERWNRRAGEQDANANT